MSDKPGFIVVPYKPDKNGQMTAILPSCCPLCASLDEQCDLKLNSTRHRKSGPVFPLSVIYCRNNEKYFTLYPPGWVPYGRKPVVNVAPDWDPAEGAPNSSCFSGTMFHAVLDAANGQFWPRECLNGHGTPRYSTQIRQINRAAILFGVANTRENSLLVKLIQSLDLPGLFLRCTVTAFKTAQDNVERSRAIRETLLEIRHADCLFRKLTAAGHAVGLWPPLFAWSVKLGQLIPASFPCLDPRGSP